MKLSDYKALTFDCYGTLIDWETGMVNGVKTVDRPAGPRAFA
jgi:2-haloacid dehalogenase